MILITSNDKSNEMKCLGDIVWQHDRLLILSQQSVQVVQSSQALQGSLRLAVGATPRMVYGDHQLRA